MNLVDGALLDRLADWPKLTDEYPEETRFLKSGNFVLSLNRYEKKKDAKLAVQAWSYLKSLVIGSITLIPYFELNAVGLFEYHTNIGHCRYLLRYYDV